MFDNGSFNDDALSKRCLFDDGGFYNATLLDVDVFNSLIAFLQPIKGVAVHVRV
jgi:hypothetical protein